MEKTWNLLVAVFFIVAAVFLYASGALTIWSFAGELGALIVTLEWFAGAVFGVIGLVKGIRLIWQEWK